MGIDDTSGEDATRSRLRWRCRRGMRELDVLLERWLSDRWPTAKPIDRERFEELLACEDDQLWDWCMGRSRPDNSDLAAIVDQVANIERRPLGG